MRTFTVNPNWSLTQYLDAAEAAGVTTLSKNEVERMFWKEVAPTIDPTDKPALREAWNNYTDTLCKCGLISARQYDQWLHPKSLRSVLVAVGLLVLTACTTLPAPAERDFSDTGVGCLDDCLEPAGDRT